MVLLSRIRVSAPTLGDATLAPLTDLSVIEELRFSLWCQRITGKSLEKSRTRDSSTLAG